MKKLIAVLMGLMVVATASVCFADTENSAVAKVYVKVDPNVAIRPLTAIVDAGSVQIGEFSADVKFRVDANKESVQFFAAASPLYKGDDPTNSEVPPIPLAKGVVIQPTNANPIAGGTNVADYGTPTTIDEFPGMQTNAITFESSQDGHFSQDVNVKFTWDQPDPEKPMGEYSGKVKLTALLLP